MTFPKSVKGYLRIALKGLLRIALRISFFIPQKDNRVLFFAGLRGYTCNPKYVADYLNAQFPNKYQLYWIGNDIKEIEGRKYLTFVKNTPWNLYVALATSKVFVTNGINSICPKSEKRLVIGTWHGTAYKKVGYDTNDALSLKDIKHSVIDIMISVSEEYTEHCIKSGFKFNGEILNCGYPRNDIFFDKRTYDAAREKVRNHYKLTGKTVLFAPTYRGIYQTAEKTDYKIEFDCLEECLRTKYGTDISLMVRMHYFDKNQYEIPNNIIDVGEWADMQEILCATDILITDYSSTIWDFALTRKPCILFVPDLDHYMGERGLYTDPETWPGILCKDMDELIKAILTLDESTCAKKADDYLRMVYSYEHGVAAESISKVIETYIES